MVWTSLENSLFNSRTASIRNLGPHNCQTQGYSGSQINKDKEILCGCLLITWPPMMININMGWSGMCHCYNAKLPYPPICIRNFFERNGILKILLFPPNFFDYNKISRSVLQLAGIYPLQVWNQNSKRIESYVRSKRCCVFFWDTRYIWV